MPALDMALIARDASSMLSKRAEVQWVHDNPGVMVVFCIVFIVAAGLIALFVHKKLKARSERKAIAAAKA
jgi:hypothetical protein